MRARQYYIKLLVSVLVTVAMLINMISADVLAINSGDQLFEGSGSESEPYLITSADDWNTLSNHINGGGTDYSGKFFKLTNDISVSTMLGYRDSSNVDIPFIGTFDGDGHTVNVSINYSGAMAAPFGCVCNAVIKNLNVTGTVNGGIHSSGLVGAGNKGAIVGSTLEIYNVTTSVAVNGYNNSVASHQGGIVGHTLSAKIIMDNVVFTGSLNASSAQGGFIGWGGGAGDKLSICILSNCLFAGTVRTGNTFHPVGYAYNNNGKATLTNFYTTKDKNNNSNKFDYQGTNYILISGLTAKVTDGSAIRYYDNFASAIAGQNWTQNSTLTLLTDVTTSSTVTVPTGEHTLDLNGHGIKKTGTGCVIKVNEQSTLNLKDSDTSKKHKYKIANPIGNGAGVATVDDTLTSGYQTFTGGYITGGYITGGYNYGAGINVEGNGATLNMYGGTVIGNRLTAGSTGGGGVCLQDWDKSGGFNMYGGLIIGNTANYGGGVYVRCGKMVMYNGEISNNVANNNIGGALLAFGNSSTFIMKDGVINGNYAQHGGAIEASGEAAVSIFGGTITNNTATGKGGALTNQRSDGDTSPAVFNISGTPVFSGNTAGGKSSDVYLCNTVVLNLTDALTNTTPFGVSRSSTTGTFTSGWKDKMGSADPSKYFTSDNDSFQVFLNDDGEAEIGIPPAASVTVGETVNKYATISDAINAWKNGGTLTLLKDATFNEIINMRPMYGYGASEYVLDLNGNTFHIKSIQVGLNNSPNTLRTGPHLTIQDSGTGGILHFSESGMIDYGGLVELRGGTLTGGNGTWGGLFLLHIYASLDMYDGVTLTGNTSTYGGAVLVGSDSVFNMYGGKITGNSASDSGGGVVIFDNDAAKFNLYSGEISGNRAPKGGGVSVNVGQFSICGSGAVIRDNVSDGSLNNETGTYTGGASSNVYLPSGKTIKVTAALSSTPVGVTLQNGEGVITSGLSDYGTEESFISDNADFEIRLENGEAIVNYPFVSGVTASDYTGDYDGKAHSISVTYPEGATVKYGTAEGSYTLSEAPAYKNVGTYTVYYKVTQDKRTFVTGSATVQIDAIDITVTITGHIITVDYNGNAHSADGYDAVASSDLYDVTKDFTYGGRAEAVRTNTGTTAMGLKADRFTNINENFNTVTFVVTDGYIEILPVDAVITTAPVSEKPIYNGSKLNLIVPGKSYGGTLYYALGDDPRNAPADDSFNTAVPQAKELGSYYVWYKVVADRNHNDLSPTYVKVVIAEESWVTLSGVLYENDGKTPLGDSVVTLTKGNQQIDYVITDSNGNYEFIVPAGTYNIVANGHGVYTTGMFKIFDNTSQDFVMSGGKTESIIKVCGDSNFGITAGGLNEEAYSIRKSGNIDSDTNVSVLMTVESKADNTATNTAAFSTLMRRKSFMFFDVKLEATVGSDITVLKTTNNVLEIAIPYTKVNRRGLSVYYSDGSGVKSFKESDSKENGTYSVDKKNGFIYIYSNQFSTFAIGYTPYYHVKSTVSLGSFKGNATVMLDGQNGEGNFELKDIDLSKISFADIPKGEYKMSVTWKDGATNTLTMPITVS